MTQDLECDVAIIGAGTAGIAAERAARREGARTLLVDPEFAGTVCATVGCMPSKLLIAAARAAAGMHRAEVFGVHAGQIRVDGNAVMRRVRQERDKFAASTRKTFDKLPEGTALKARASFVEPTLLQLDDGRRISARAVVIATGSEPAIPPPYQDLGDLLLTNRNIFEMDDLPDSLAVIGAGPLGLELAQAMGQLGVRVTVFDRGTTLAKIRCPKVHEALKNALQRDVSLQLGVEPSPSRDSKKLRLEWNEGKDSDSFDRVLVAAGRPPSLKGLDLEQAGIPLNDKGVPQHDPATMQCSDLPVFIAGDVDTDRPVLHEASAEGAIAGRNAARFPTVRASNRMVPFTVAFTDPPLAQLGAEPGDDSVDGIADYSDQGRAKVEARAEGLAHLYADAQGRLTGAELCAPDGEHLAHLLAWAVEAGLSAPDLLKMPFYHPTLEEGLRPALRQICKALSLPVDTDPGDPPGC